MHPTTEGHRARSQGEPHTDNPHRPETDEHTLWCDAWAERDWELANPTDEQPNTEGE